MIVSFHLQYPSYVLQLQCHPFHSPFSFIRSIGGFQVVGTYTEGGRLEGRAQESLLVVKVGPSALTAGVAELARSQKTSRLSFTHVCCTVSLVLTFLQSSFGGGAKLCEISAMVRAGGLDGGTIGFVRDVAGIRDALVLVIWVDSPVVRYVDGSS